MNEFAILSLIMAMAAFFTANFIYIKNPHSRLNQIITIFGFTVALMNFTEFAYRFLDNYESTIIWFQLSGLWALIPALMFHISVLSTNRTNFLQKPYAYPLIYIPSLIFVFIGVFTDLLRGPIIREYWGWAYTIGDNPFFYLFALWTIIIAFTAGILVLIKYFQSRGVVKKQALFIFIGLFFPLIVSLIFDLLLQYFPQKFPELTQTTGALGLIFIAYGVWRYDFPQLTQVMAAEKIISTMSNLLLLLDPSGYIISTNTSTTNILGFTDKDLRGRNFQELFPQNLDYYLKELSGKNNQIEIETRIKTLDDKKIPVLISLSPIFEGRNEILGYICIGTDITEQKKFQDQLLESEFKFRSVVEQTSDGIVLANQDIKIIYWNHAMEQITGIKREEAEGQFYYQIMHELISPDQKENMTMDMLKKIFTEVFNTKKMEYHLESTDQEILTKDNAKKSIITFNFFIKKSFQPLLCTVVRDVTNSKLAENSLKSSLKEKEVLLREIHHRVKNNMQIVSSLLNLQSYSVKDKITQNLFKESQNRVKSMSIIHENLYNSSDLAHIDFKRYIKRLASELFSSYGVDLEKIRFTKDVQDIQLDINSAIPLGLILNELMSNSLKYAFPDGEGEISIKFTREDDHYHLDIADDGVGIPDEIDFKNTSTLGLELVNSLVRQLEGKIELDTSKGTHFHIEFKEVHYEPRL
ncbi:MAG: histidine kinase dimerization/phosphoacceptor domain -containing protein [Methanomicrobiales archaeon]